MPKLEVGIDRQAKITFISRLDEGRRRCLILEQLAFGILPVHRWHLPLHG
jgi:hypothetical protein